MPGSILRLAACAGLLLLGVPALVQSQAASAPNYVMVIHGGAGTILRSRMTPTMEKAYIDTLTIALRTGYQILQRGGSSLDAVEAAIRIMEDCPLFNAADRCLRRDRSRCLKETEGLGQSAKEICLVVCSGYRSASG